MTLRNINSNTPSIRHLRKIVRYNPKTGKLYWLNSPKNGRHVAGEEVTLTRTGTRYIVLFVYPRMLFGHRVAWALHYGKWPKFEIDHINGDPGDNRIVNLRRGDNKINRQNRHRPNRTNTTGLIGVVYHPETGKYEARIFFEGKGRYLGIFKTAEEAHQKYLQTKRLLHKGCMI